MADTDRVQGPEAAPHQIEPALEARDAAIGPAPTMLEGARAGLGGGLLQRKIARRLARKAVDANGVAADAASAVSGAAGSSGSALPVDVQRKFEGSLGADLGSVRVHTGSASAAAAESLSARAYTVGNDIHFAAGQYDPASSAGQHLLAHEVAHTVQQSGGGASRSAQFKLEVSSPEDSHEHEADRAADAMVRGEAAHVVGGGTPISRNIFGDIWSGIKSAGQAIGHAAQAVGHAIVEGVETLGDWITDAAALAGIVHFPEGMIAQAVPAAGGQPALPVGTFVRVTAASHDGKLRVHAYSGIDKDCVIPKDSFRPEPGLVHTHDASGKDTGIRDDVYQEYTGPLWGPDGPKAADAYTQGALGDCYFMASMAAVCGSNPDAIKRLFSPQTPSRSYTISLYKRGLTGGFSRVSYTVDAFLPSARGQDHQQVYANTGAQPSAKNSGPTGNANQGALWVSFLEKAWAMHKGSYEAAAGGWGADGMEALTGVASQKENPAGSDGKGGGLIDKFRQFQSEGRAVAVGTIKDPAEQNHGWTTGKFTQTGNKFEAQLDPSLVFQTVQVWDNTSAKQFYGKDDSNNNILRQSGAARLVEGKVDYQDGKVTLTFDASAMPDNAANLKVAWNNCGADFQKYGLCGTHEYHFVSVREPDAVNLMNPWGYQHPKPVDAPGMAKCFSEIASNQVPGAQRPGATAGATAGAAAGATAHG